VIGTIVWIGIIENLATGLFGGVAPYLPGRVGYALANAVAAGDLVPVATGALLLLLYTGAAGFVGLLLLRRDVSAA
jgi:hypothetical protein